MIQVRGRASAEEIAAVLAALRRGSPDTEPSGYEQWRRQRIAVRPEALNRKAIVRTRH